MICNFAAAVFLAWTVVHYVTANMYAAYCTSWGLSGVLMSPLLVRTPQCQVLRWGIENGALALETMWIAGGAYLVRLAMTRGLLIHRR